MRLNKLLSVLSVSVTAFTVTIPAYAVSYTITDLSLLSGNQAYGYGINASSQATGSSFIYDGSNIVAITGATGYSINDSGQVAGRNKNANKVDSAFYYDGGSMQNIGTLGGSRAGAFGINNSSQIVGFSETSGSVNSSNIHAFLYDGGVMQDLGTLGGTSSAANSINNRGQIAGYSQNSAGDYRAFLYDNGVMQDIGTLGGTTSYAFAINDNGQAVGYADITGDAEYHAFIYDGSNMLDLGTMPGYTHSRAYGINNNGQVVGHYGNRGPGGQQAFLYDGVNMLDLCALTDCLANGWDRLYAARGINDNGDIVGYGYVGAQTHAFLISAVPVPAAVWLFGSGFLGLTGLARRKRNRRLC